MIKNNLLSDGADNLKLQLQLLKGKSESFSTSAVNDENSELITGEEKTSDD